MKRTTYGNFILLDGTENMQPQEGLYLTVEDGKIVELCGNKPDGKVVDLGGRYLMPGLINLHVHLPAGGVQKKKQADNKKLVKLVLSTWLTRQIGLALCASNAKKQLFSGVTTIRTVGGVGNLDTALRDKINRGKCVGPRILASDYAIGPVGGHMVGSVAVAVQNEEQAVSEVQKLIRHNVDLIKLMITGGVLDAVKRGEPGKLKMPANLIKACCDEAHKHGLKVAAHVQSAEGVQVAIANGVDTIEHGADFGDKEAQLFLDNDAAFVCTLSPAVPLGKLPLDVAYCTEVVQYNTNVILQGVIDGTKQALKRGIKVGLGTDTGCPFVTHYDTWRELDYFVKLVGVTPTFALHTATLVNAVIAGVGDVTGSIQVGKSADFVVTDGNPLDNFAVIGTPYMVSTKGKTYTKPHVKKFESCERALNMIEL